MFIMEYLIYIFLSILLITNSITLYYLYKFSIILVDLEDDIEESLDDIEDAWIAMNKILEKPIFFDSMEVRQCILEIKKSRLAVVKIADRLTSFGQDDKNRNKQEGYLSNERKKEDA
jgi:hypothetical protein